jgi:uncharacterized membrane protein
MSGRVIVWALAAAAVVWFALVVSAPRLPAALAAMVYVAGALVCHQRPERSFHLDGAQLAVCARCTGIYFGACAAAAVALLPPSRYSRLADARIVGLILAGAALPTAVTVAAEWAAWWLPSSAVRAAAGLPLGVAGAFVVTAAFAPRRQGSKV